MIIAITVERVGRLIAHLVLLEIQLATGTFDVKRWRRNRSRDRANRDREQDRSSFLKDLEEFNEKYL